MSYNSRSPAVKRLMKEAQELAEPTELYYAQPLEDNLFEWHFTIRGPEDTDFQNGIYHGRILLPSEYPMKPPNILLLTPNGRFEIKRKICLSISGYHPESWRPCWSIRTALLAIIGFMPTHGGGAIGSLDFSSEERKKLAKSSVDFECPECGPTRSILRPQTEASIKDREEAKTLAKQIDFQAKNEKQKSAESAPTEAAAPAAAETPGGAANTNMAAPGFPMAPAAAAWPYLYPYYLPFYQPGLPANMAPPAAPLPNMAGPGAAQPLPFEQWLIQVKGYKAPGTAQTAPSASDPTPAAPAAAASAADSAEAGPAKPGTTSASEEGPAAPTASDPVPSTSGTGEQEQRSASASSSGDPAPVDTGSDEAGPAATPEQQQQQSVAEEADALSELRRRAHVGEEWESPAADSAVHSMASGGEEWPMLSLFVICFLLIAVLLLNRFLLPLVLARLSNE